MHRVELSAATPAELQEVSALLHDADIEGASLVHDVARRELRLAFAQEARWLRELPQPEPVRETWRHRELHVPFLRGVLVVRHVLDVDAPEGWDDLPELLGLDHDAARGQLVLRAAFDPVRISVERLDVTAGLSADVAFLVSRRVGRLLGVESDRRIGDAG